jgi:hypothetical protein
MHGLADDAADPDVDSRRPAACFLQAVRLCSTIRQPERERSAPLQRSRRQPAPAEGGLVHVWTSEPYRDACLAGRAACASVRGASSCSRTRPNAQPTDPHDASKHFGHPRGGSPAACVPRQMAGCLPPRLSVARVRFTWKALHTRKRIPQTDEKVRTPGWRRSPKEVLASDATISAHILAHESRRRS